MTGFPLKSFQKGKLLFITALSLSSPNQTAKALSPLLRRCPDRRLPLPTALSLFSHTIKSNTHSNPFLFNLILYTLIPHSLPSARNLFDQMPQRDRNLVTHTLLVDAHMKRGLVREALPYFETIPSSSRSVITYTATIAGLVRNGLAVDAISLFCRMISDRDVMPNEITFSTVIRACTMLSVETPFRFGESIVGLIVKTNFERSVSVCNSLITMFVKKGDVNTASRVFHEMGEGRDVVSWTALLDVHFETGDTEGARRVFDSMPERNEVSWSTMVARLSQNGEAEEALRVFVHMIHNEYKPNVSCFASALSACAKCRDFALGTNVHSLVSKSGFVTDPFVGSSLIDMYSKCGQSRDGRRVFDLIVDKNIVVWNSMLGGYGFDGRVEDAEEIFQIMPDRNVVTWNVMISCYDLNERYGNALETFDELLASGKVPDGMTFSSVLHSCANLPSLEKGKNLHGKNVKLGFESQVFVGTALVDMYSKSRDIESLKRVFFAMREKNEVTWTAMIEGLAHSGLPDESLDLFEEMKRTAIVPNETMFLSVLFACSQCGLVDKGFHYFESMEKEYGISPNERHYTCMVDLLARAGLLREAEEFINGMPVEPESMSWAALLSACCTYKNVEIGERAAKKITELGKGSSSAGYVLLSNIYTLSGRWKKVAKVRRLMRKAGLKKGGGCSWIQIGNHFHPFYSWDANHIESFEIYGMLELLMSDMGKFSSEWVELVEV